MDQVNTSNSWQRSRVVGTAQLSSNIKEVTLEMPEGFSFTPGQYIKARIQIDGQNIERYYSVSSKANNNLLKIAVEKIEGGILSKYIHNLKLGSELEIKGPMGEHFQLIKPNSLFISGGIGIAPFMSLEEKVRRSSLFLASFKSVQNVPWMEELVGSKNVKIFLTKEQDMAFKKAEGFILRRFNIDDIAQALINLESKRKSIYICGGTIFVESVRQQIVNSELKNYEIFTEMFG